MVTGNNRILRHLQHLEDDMAVQKSSRSERPLKGPSAENIAKNLHWELTRDGAPFKSTEELAIAVAARFGDATRATLSTLQNWRAGDTGMPTGVALEQVAVVLGYADHTSLKKSDHIERRTASLSAKDLPAKATKEPADNAAFTPQSIFVASSYDTLTADDTTTRAVIEQVLSHPRAGEHLRLFAFMLRNITSR